MATVHPFATTTHGRYLVEQPRIDPPTGLLFGFHGYGEPAEAQLDRLRAVPGAADWLLVSVQGLHRFYNRRSEDVVASWMTSQDRDLAIADNVSYVLAVVETIARASARQLPVVFAGFSQGVAMAFRAACSSVSPISGVVSVGGDVPPELDAAALSRVPRAFLARGERDEWYTHAKWTADDARLSEAGVDVRVFGYHAGHEWNADVSAAVERFLAACRASRR